MSPTKLEKIAKVVTDLYERTNAATIKVGADNGTYIEVKREEYRRIVRKKGNPVQDFLMKLDPQLERKRQGAWQTLEGSTTDKHAQAANSMRDVLSQLLDRLAPSVEVTKASWYKKPKQGNPVTRAMRVQWAIAGNSANVSSSTLEQIETLVKAVDATYAKLSAEGHEGKPGKDQITRACMKACESVIELIAASRENMEI
jgi:hypothetical protein